MAKRYVSNADMSPRMFENDVLEALSRVHPAVPHLIFVPVVVFMLARAWQLGVGPGAILALFVAGALLWTLAEYTIHRFGFHMGPEFEHEVRDIAAGVPPGEAILSHLPRLKQRIYFIVHGVHHDFPKDSRRLVMPPSVSVPLAFVFYFLFRFVMGTTLTPAFFAGFVSMYLFYDTAHYAVHHLSLKGRVGSALRKSHLRHHYKHSTMEFGVSSPLWDVMLGTLPPGDGPPAEVSLTERPLRPGVPSGKAK